MALCYICTQPHPDSRDHVIPECFFPPPRPGNMLTLPAHRSCHARLPEEFVRNLMSGLSGGDSAAAGLLWEGSVARAFARNAPLRDTVWRGLVRSTDVHTPGGIYLGTAPAIRFPREMVYPSLEKIVRGLYHRHTGRLLRPDTHFRWGINELLYGGRQHLFEAATNGLSYPGVFACRYIVIVENGLETTLWWLQFYGATVFRCYTPAQAPGLSASRGRRGRGRHRAL